MGQMSIKIADKLISSDTSCFVIAELSGNHDLKFERAVKMIREAKQCGADAVKLQTYRADTITLKSDKKCFWTNTDSLWRGMTLYELYEKAYTPWEWQPDLKQVADDEGIILFSSPFDFTAVDFLEKMEMPAYKVASFEITDIPLIRRIARTGRPILISTGAASLSDIECAVDASKSEGNDQIILLKCVSEYPTTSYEEINLRTIHSLSSIFGTLTGLSDHTLGDEIPIAAVALGAKVIEKHFTLKRSDGGADAGFSMEPQEFHKMVTKIRNTEKALGQLSYRFTNKMKKARKDSRSLFTCKPIKKGELFTADNVKSVRPANGLPPILYEELLGKEAACDIEYATPLSYCHVIWE